MAAIPEATIEHTLEPIPTPVGDIADLARREAERLPEPYSIDADSRLVVVKLRNDERVDTFDLEQYLDKPTRPRGTVTVHDPDDFTGYVNRLANPNSTTVWADVDAGKVTAVINDHPTWDEAGWRDCTIQLRLQPDEDWRQWAARDGKLVEQAEFAEFVENVAHTIVEPDAATMLEIALNMSAKRSVEFSQGTRLDTGDVRLRFEETTQANAGVKGQLEIPERITVQLAPWRGVIVADLVARLRWRINGGKLFIGYKLLRPELFASDVFNSLVERVRAALDVPMYRGVTPTSLR